MTRTSHMPSCLELTDSPISECLAVVSAMMTIPTMTIPPGLAVTITLVIGVPLPGAVRLTITLAIDVTLPGAVRLTRCVIVANTIIIFINIVSAKTISVCIDISAIVSQVIADIITECIDMLTDILEIVTNTAIVHTDTILASTWRCGEYIHGF